MKKVYSKIKDVLSLIFGYGILISLFIGGISFIGYIIALIIGGDTATSICNFIYKTVYPYLVYGTSVIVLLGILIMYLKGEVALTTTGDKNKKREESNDKKKTKQNEKN